MNEHAREAELKRLEHRLQVMERQLLDITVLLRCLLDHQRERSYPQTVAIAIREA